MTLLRVILFSSFPRLNLSEVLYQKKIKKADWREQSRAFREAINMTGAPKGEEEED